MPAQSGEQALQALLTEEFAVVLLDAVLRGLPAVTSDAETERTTAQLAQRVGRLRDAIDAFGDGGAVSDRGTVGSGEVIGDGGVIGGG